jgi:hypothetical protein
MPTGKKNVDDISGGQTFINRLVWENGYALIVNGASRGDALLDVSLLRPENLVKSCTIEQGMSDQCELLLEIEWEENYCRPQVERLVALCNKTNILGICTFLLV